MENFKESYNLYGNFDRELFFVSLFNCIPCTVNLCLPLDDSKESMEKVLALISDSNTALEVVYKNWDLEEYQSEVSNDYAKNYLFKDVKRKVVVWISLDDKELTADFQYAIEEKEAESWILAIGANLREEFGKEKTPSFSVLTRTGNGFYAEEVATNNSEKIEIDCLYNDDFFEVDEIVKNAITTDSSGLILLHGKPGTGKTSYIRHLISVFRDTVFIFIQNEFVEELLKPQFVSFLLKHKNCVLIIEDAEKVVSSRETQHSSVVSTILQLTDGLFSDYLNIKVICSFNTDLRKIDAALLRKGRLIARYEFGNLTKEKTNFLLKKNGIEAQDNELSLAEIFNLRDKNFSQIKKVKMGFV